MSHAAAPHILMLLENNPYPQDRRVLQEALTLVGAGYRVSIICPAHAGQPLRETLDAVRVYRFPAPPSARGFLGYLIEYGWSMSAAFVLSLWIFWREGFEVIHAHNPPDTFVCIAALFKLFGKRFVFDHHDLTPEMYYARFPGQGMRLVHRSLLFFEKLSCRLADQVIAANASYKALEMQRHGIPSGRITIVRNGPALERLRLTAPPSGLRRTGKIIIGYAGVIGFQDGAEYLLRALHHLKYGLGRTDFFCVIVGDGAAFPSLLALGKQLNLNEQMLYTGWVEPAEVARYLSAADICAAPEPSNAYNDRSTVIKIMEYMALGKPIVAFDLPEHRFSAQAAALYAPPNDERAFARALAELMDDPMRRQVMGAAGRLRVETELAWRHSAPRLLEAYRLLFTQSGNMSRSVTSDAMAQPCPRQRSLSE